MSVPLLREIHLKSFKRATLPLGSTTVLMGRNSSGKSNALDAIEVLGRLASGEDIEDALDGRRREGGAIRGGSAGCAPHGMSAFELGCRVYVGPKTYKYALTIQVRPALRVVREELTGPAPVIKTGIAEPRRLISTPTPGATGTGIAVTIFNGKPGRDPSHSFRDSRLVISQVPLQINGRDNSEKAVLTGVDAVLGALRGIFHLDPVPHLMRGYVPERDADLRRTAENLSASLAALRTKDFATFERILRLVQEVADEKILSLDVTRSPLGDVMMTLVADTTGTLLTPAREMSDGLLRFTAIAAALLTSSHGLDVDPAVRRIAANEPSSILLVIEELENGLHPSRARRMLQLVLEANGIPGTSVLLTTHSLALLTAAEGKLMHDLLVCYRATGTDQSKISPMADTPGYAEALAEGSVGDAVTRGKLTAPKSRADEYEEFNRLLCLN